MELGNGVVLNGGGAISEHFTPNRALNCTGFSDLDL